MQTLIDIRTALNTTEAVTAGLSHADAAIHDNTVTFTFPAPVVSGACCAVITLNDDGSIHDDTGDQTFASFDEWLADLNELMEV